MENKTCGECKYFKQNEEVCLHDKKHYWSKKEFDACTGFEAKPVTNGDVIRQGGNRALAEFQQQNTCDNCVYNNHSGFHSYCDKPVDKTCTDGIEAWLNAPADCIGKDTNVPAKESEGCNANS